MNRTIIALTLALSLLFLTTSQAGHGGNHGTYVGEQSGNESGTESGTFTGTATRTDTITREYVVYGSSFNAASALNINYTPIILPGTVDTSKSYTVFQYSFQFRLEPSGISSSTASTDIRVNDVGVGCFSSASRPIGAEVEDVRGYRECAFTYQQNTQSTGIHFTPTNAVNFWWTLTIRQVEVVNITYSSDVSGTYTGSYSGSNAGTHDGSITDELSADGNMTVNNVNVTLESDPNEPASRIYAWIVGVFVFLVVFAEWRKDSFYYLLAMLGGIFVVTEMPDFLPDAMRGIPIAVMLYMGVRSWNVFATTRAPTQS